MNISRKYLRKYKGRTFVRNTKKSHELLRRHSEKYLTAKELFRMTRLKRIKFSSHKTKKKKLSSEIKSRMKMIKYINRQCRRVLKHHKIKTFAKEFKGRMKEKSRSFPVDGKKYKYYYKQNEGQNYIIYYARVGCDEVEILNIEALSKGHDYFAIEDMAISYDEKYIAFSVDLSGNRLCKLFIKPLFSNNYEEVLVNKKSSPLVTTHDFLSNGSEKASEKKYSAVNSGNCVWSPDSKSIYYITYDKSLRPYQVYLYNIETKKHSFVFEEKKKDRSIHISGVNSGEHVVLYSSTYNGGEVYIINECETRLIYKLKPDVDYFLNHKHATWFVFRKKRGSYSIFLTHDFKKESLCIHNKPHQQFSSMYLQGDFILVFYKSRGFNKLMAYHYCEKKMMSRSIRLCKKDSGCSFAMPAFNNLNDYVNHCTVNVYSFLMPITGHFIDLNTMDIKQVYEQKVRTYKPGKYAEKILYVTKDLHIIMMYKKGISLRNAKCVLWGYGSYGITRDPEFDIYIPSLLDRGFLFCIGYIRGGGRHGHRWYEQGRLLNKMNTFTDFIDCAKYLIKQQYTSSKRLAIWGRSAGGLLIGGTINMEPELCQLAILGVPFLDPIRVLADKSNPLAIESHIEWGDPSDPKILNYMKKYSPQDNICLQSKYPNIYIYSNLNDTLVPYMEPFNYYMKIKEAAVFREGKRDIHMQIKTKFGHSQSSKRYDNLNEMGEIYDIILKYIV